MRFVDANGKPRIGMGLLPRDEKLFVSVHDEKGVVRANLGSVRVESMTTGKVFISHTSSLVLFDGKGDVIWAEPKSQPLGVCGNQNHPHKRY